MKKTLVIFSLNFLISFHFCKNLSFNFLIKLLLLLKQGMPTVGLFRSSRPEVFCKKAVLKNFAKFTGKHLCQSLLFSKVAVLRPATLLKRRLWHRCFPVDFVKFLRTPFRKEYLWATASAY